MSKLVVYRASAGSGKTFRLAAEYIKQVIANPDSFRNILAVTFTNKATAEMKGRILNELFAMSKGEETPMSKEVAKELSMPHNLVKAKAQKALSLILHDYSRFSISTIDSFVQRVIQALLWEIGEQGSIDIELDNKMVLEHAADNLLDSASTLEDLLKWLTVMGYSLIDEGKSWDVRGSLIDLGQQLFSEKFRLMSREDVQKFTDKDQINTLKSSLQEIIKATAGKVRSIGSESTQRIAIQGIEIDSFAYALSGVMGYFVKCSQMDTTFNEIPAPVGVRVIAALSDPSGEKWVTKTLFNNKAEFAPIQKAIEEYLHPALENLVNTYNQNNAEYVSAKLLLKNLENLALIGDLWNKVRELSRDEGFLLLSDSGHLLKDFVKGSDAPFVYEKVGTRYNVFMIDEFQDTSEVQWHNFKPLLENSLSQDYFSMIVGDVKQSIYRWRNGDWSILASGVEEDFAHFGIEEQSLSTNRRSLPAIIGFNNSFFDQAKNIAIASISNTDNSLSDDDVIFLQSQIAKAYKDVEQHSPSTQTKKQGYVEVSFYEQNGSGGHNDYLERKLPMLVKELQQYYHLKDIAILVRTKRDGQRVANMLMEYNKGQESKASHITFVSQEGLLLRSSNAVRLITAAFELIHDPSNEVTKRVLSKEIANLGDTNPDWHSVFQQESINQEVEWLSNLSTRPVHEIFDLVITHFNLKNVSGEVAYVAELHEHIANLSSKGGGDLAKFISWWHKKGADLSLSVPESVNALSIVTIHKSKGLQFPVVILPYLNWKYREKSKEPILWVKSNTEPFNMLPQYPIKANSLSKKSLFSKDVLYEEMREMVDNINLLYVAFTRPEKELYTFIPLSSKEFNGDLGKIDNVAKLNRAIIPMLQPNPSSVSENPREDVFTFGEQKKEIDRETLNYANRKSWQLNAYSTTAASQKVKLKLESIDFFNSSPSTKSRHIEHGKVMHTLFSCIATVYDIDAAIQSLCKLGLLSSEAREPLKAQIHDLLNNPPFNDWFSGKWQIKNEASILTPEGKLYRPDRVMSHEDYSIVVDFKFGGKIPTHRKQVKNYMQLLQSMGYNNISGYIWYVDSGELDKLS